MKPHFVASYVIVLCAAVLGFMLYNLFWGSEMMKESIRATILFFIAVAVIAGAVHGIWLYFYNKQR